MAHKIVYKYIKTCDKDKNALKDVFNYGKMRDKDKNKSERT